MARRKEHGPELLAVSNGSSAPLSESILLELHVGTFIRIFYLCFFITVFFISAVLWCSVTVVGSHSRLMVVLEMAVLLCCCSWMLFNYRVLFRVTQDDIPVLLEHCCVFVSVVVVPHPEYCILEQLLRDVAVPLVGVE